MTDSEKRAVYLGWEQPGLRLPFDGTLSEAEQRMLEQFTVATLQELKCPPLPKN